MHKLPLQIRFNDIDMFGHVNNTVYLQFFDLGKLMFFKSLCPDFEHEPTVPVVANINVNFLQPTYIKEEIAVETHMEKVGESSMTLSQRIVCADGGVRCEATTVMVNIDVATGRPTPVSDWWREAFKSVR